MIKQHGDSTARVNVANGISDVAFGGNVGRTDRPHAKPSFCSNSLVKKLARNWLDSWRIRCMSDHLRRARLSEEGVWAPENGRLRSALRSGGQMLLDPGHMIGALERFIREQGHYAAVKVENLAVMSGGVSHEMWAFDASLETQAKRTSSKLVLRRDVTGEQTYSGRRGEFMVMRAAHGEGIPVPEALWLCEDATVLGASFFIMEFVPGETIARRLLRDEQYARTREVIAQQMAEILALIHRIDAARYGLAFLPAPAGSAAVTEVLRYERMYRQFSGDEPHPVFELAIRWLLEHRPRSRRALVHGDYRIGNVIYGPEGVRAVLDFEGTHWGDPAEDIGWMMMRPWRYGEEAVSQHVKLPVRRDEPAKCCE